MRPDDVEFGPFRLHIARRELSRDGTPVQLGGRALDILLVLAAAKGEVVGKDQLIAKVWSGTIVDENNIQVHVSALRKALGITVRRLSQALFRQYRPAPDILSQQGAQRIRRVTPG